MKIARLVLLILPWIIIIFFLYDSNEENNQNISLNSSAILKEIESLGKLELVRYNFKEITEVEELSKEYFNLFKLGPDSRIALISEGEAVGCIDLTKLKEHNISATSDTLYVQLPAPEICYYKLNLDKTRIYALQTNPLKDERRFIEQAYKHAELEIKNAAVSSGILDQTNQNADKILRPLLENISGRTVVFLPPLPDNVQLSD